MAVSSVSERQMLIVMLFVEEEEHINVILFIGGC